MSIKKLASLVSAFTLVGAATLGMSGVTHAQSTQETSDVTIKITAGNIAIGIDNNADLAFGTQSVSTSPENYEKSYTDMFWVEDMEGAEAGYHTTLQMSGDLVSESNETIPAANVKVRTTGAIQVMNGTENSNVKIATDIATGFTSLDGAKNFIERGNDPSGRVGKYGITPEMQITVPAYQAVGEYSGTLVYTLYEN